MEGNSYMVHLLELAFSEKSLRDVCESQLKAERTWGIAVAATLRSRLADLRDAECVNDLVAGPPKMLDDNPPGRVALPLGDSVFLVFCANHSSLPKKESGEVNWSGVTRIKIVEIGGAQ
jgi:hypothetical protein